MSIVKLLLFVMITIVSLDSHSSETLRVGFVEFPPFYYTDENGKAQGHITELTKQIATKAGFEVSFHSYPPKRLAKNLVAGDVDFWVGLATLENFSGNTEISSMPVVSEVLRAYSTKPMPEIKRKSDLNGRHVIVLLGYSYGDWFDYIKDPQNNITHESAIKHDQALRMLLSHRVDYLLDYQLPINLALANMETPKLYYHDVFSIEGHIVVSKKLPNAKQILRRLEDSYKSLQLNPVK
ncbi:MAG: transporter substrate-binding domain-containing protein [Agarilytica sp.]